MAHKDDAVINFESNEPAPDPPQLTGPEPWAAPLLQKRRPYPPESGHVVRGEATAPSVRVSTDSRIATMPAYSCRPTPPLGPDR
jgi:hypothetical protein